jgi:hypothetical protein
MVRAREVFGAKPGLDPSVVCVEPGHPHIESVSSRLNFLKYFIVETWVQVCMCAGRTTHGNSLVVCFAAFAVQSRISLCFAIQSAVGIVSKARELPQQMGFFLFSNP